MVAYQWFECPCSRKAAFLIFRDPEYVPMQHEMVARSELYQHADGTPMAMHTRIECATCRRVHHGPLNDIFQTKNIKRGDELPQ